MREDKISYTHKLKQLSLNTPVPLGNRGGASVSGIRIWRSERLLDMQG
jgi:hypothetical protein